MTTHNLPFGIVTFIIEELSAIYILTLIFAIHAPNCRIFDTTYTNKVLSQL